MSDDEIIDYSVGGFCKPRRCRVLESKPGPRLRNMRTGERYPSVRLYLQPINGERAFWTVPMRDVREVATPTDGGA